MGRVRKPRPLWPYREAEAEALFEALEAGWTLGDALDRAGISERCIYAWCRHAQRRDGGPELEPYKAFSRRFRKVIGVAMGMGDG